MFSPQARTFVWFYLGTPGFILWLNFNTINSYHPSTSSVGIAQLLAKTHTLPIRQYPVNIALCTSSSEPLISKMMLKWSLYNILSLHRDSQPFCGLEQGGPRSRSQPIHRLRALECPLITAKADVVFTCDGLYSSDLTIRPWFSNSIAIGVKYVFLCLC